MADRSRSILSAGSVLAAGIVIGVLLAGGRSPALHAGGGDHPNAPITTTVTVATDVTKERIPIPMEAVVYLNYAKGYLLAAVPMPLQTGSGQRALSDFAALDLVKDFALPLGTAAHFSMASGQMGATGDGWAPLYVFESTTGQVAAYRILPRAQAGSSAPSIQLVEKRSDPRLATLRKAN